MRVGLLPVGLVALLGLSACGVIQSNGPAQPTISIELDAAIQPKARAPSKQTSPCEFPGGLRPLRHRLRGHELPRRRNPLGHLQGQRDLDPDRFEMDPALIKQSGKSKAYLKENLFKNMSAIDFKGDGETNEYGNGYISLEPLSDTEQPFKFNETTASSAGTAAIHGTNDKSRVGQQVTGGCINVDDATMGTLLKSKLAMRSLQQRRTLQRINPLPSSGCWARAGE